MTGFTSLSDGKNSTEYSRQYVDEASERSDVVGYAPAIDYEFDRYTNDPVHEKIAAITDDEILGTEAQVDIVVVDLFEQKTSETTCISILENIQDMGVNIPAFMQPLVKHIRSQVEDQVKVDNDSEGE